MEMNWSTFVLEIINFLVLVWILKRFLYKPVLNVISRRRAGIQKTLAEAKTHHTEAEKLQEQYESRLADWEQEKAKERKKLAQELEAERVRKTAELQTSLEQEKEKANVAAESRRQDAMRKIEGTALIHGARFAAYLLKKGSGPDTEIRLVELVISELLDISAEGVASFRSRFGKTAEEIVVASAFPLPDDLRRRLEQALAKAAGLNIPPRFEQNSELLAGLEITIGSLVLGANLRDELKGFTALTHGK